MTCIFQGIDMDMEWLGQWTRVEEKKHKKMYIGRPLVYCTHVMHILRHASFLWHTWGALMRWASNLVYIDQTLVQPQWHQQLQLLTFFKNYPSCYNYDSEFVDDVALHVTLCDCSYVLEQQIFQFGWGNFVAFFVFESSTCFCLVNRYDHNTYAHLCVWNTSHLFTPSMHVIL